MNMDTGSDDVRIEMIGGVVDRKVEQGLHRQIFRASRSNAITYFTPIDDVQLNDPDTQEPVNLSVVLVFFQRSGGAQEEDPKVLHRIRCAHLPAAGHTESRSGRRYD